MTNPFKISIDPKRTYGLDILRAIAIITILIFHGNVLLLNFNQPILFSWVRFDGVSIFFVLSGFLIGGILIKSIEKNEANFKTLLTFWKRRWLRTMPMYFIVLTIIFFLSILKIANIDHPIFKYGYMEYSKVLQFYFFVQNIVSPHPSFFPEAWSLSIEEWFYIITPLTIILSMIIFRINLKKALLISSVLIIIFSMSLRLHYYSIINLDSMADFANYIRNRVFTRLDGMMYGVIGAYIYHYHNKFWLKYKYHSLGIGALLLILSEIAIGSSLKIGLFYSVFYFTLFSSGILFLLPFLSDLKSGKGILYKTITTISLISYSLYLINFMFVGGFLVLGTLTLFKIKADEFTLAYLSLSLFWIYSVSISILTYKYIELPFMNLREK